MEISKSPYITLGYSLSYLKIHTTEGKKSEFDVWLETYWERKMNDNLFRYTLEGLETRYIPGKYGFIAQLNIKRGAERRKPQYMTDVIMPFDDEKFHFGKINKNEILFELEPLHWQRTADTLPCRSLIIINVSPVEFCNSLLVPCIEKCYPQVLNFDALRLALETIAFSHNPALRIGMNSLGAYASVNHLHFHLYYLKETLQLQYCEMNEFIGDCYEIGNFPSKGFAFQIIEIEKLIPIARSIMKLIEYLQQERIAHNIFITRGKDFSDNSQNKDTFNAIRIFVWARKSSFGSKLNASFNPALCELAGHLVITERNYFENITEENVVNILEDMCNEVYSNVKEKVKEIYLSSNQ